MNCLECEQNGVHRPAVALCHNCSAALCREHAVVVPQHLMASMPVCRTVDLPVPARVILCQTCHEAMSQPHLMKTA